MPYRVGILLFAVLSFGLAGLTAASAQQGQIAIELNKSESADDGCRLYVNVHNTTGMEFRVFSAEFVFFDANGVMSSSSLVSFGKLRPNKNHFQRFTFPSIACGDVGRILLNDVQQCQHDGDGSFDCLSAVSVSHKGSIELVK